VTDQMETKGRRRTEISLPGMPLFKSIYNEGKSIVMEMGAAPRELDAEELMSAKRECDMLAELHLAQYGIEAELKGIELQQGEECYVVEMKKANGEFKTNYYSVASGLLLLEREVKSMEDKPVTEETIYSNYQEANGVKYASKRTVNAGGQSYVININKATYNTPIPAEQFNLNQK